MQLTKAGPKTMHTERSRGVAMEPSLRMPRPLESGLEPAPGLFSASDAWPDCPAAPTRHWPTFAAGFIDLSWPLRI